MSRRVSFRPEAEAEALETRDWYEGRRPGLGAEFRAALDETIERIADNPMQFRLVRGETRRAILNRFPYAVYFRPDGNDIVVLAVHGRQHPRRWQSRPLTGHSDADLARPLRHEVRQHAYTPIPATSAPSNPNRPSRRMLTRGEFSASDGGLPNPSDQHDVGK